jgi:hypothetical protein
MSEPLPITDETGKRIAVALEGLLELKRKEFAEEKPWAKAKPPEVWVQCSVETVRLLDGLPYLDLEHVPDDSILRAPDGGNIARENQFRRFLKQHAIPNKPDAKTGVKLTGLGKADRDGPPFVARADSLHCAKAALADYAKWERGDDDRKAGREMFGTYDSECHFCQTVYQRVRAEREVRETARRAEKELVASMLKR